MPHLEMPDSRHIRKAAVEKHGEEEGSPHFLSSGELFDILRNKYEERVLGSGGECIVVPIDGQEQKVAAYMYYHRDKKHLQGPNKSNSFSPSEAKQVFYTHRIFSILFPHNFPHFYAAFGGTRNGSHGGINSSRPTGTIRQKITGPQGRVTAFGEKLPTIEKVKQLLGLNSKFPPVQFPFAKVEKAAKEMGSILKYDPASMNFMVGSDGGEYYVDNLLLSTEKLLAGRKNILPYMAKHGYSEEDQRMVQTSLDRLQAIQDSLPSGLKQEV